MAASFPLTVNFEGSIGSLILFEMIYIDPISPKVISLKYVSISFAWFSTIAIASSNVAARSNLSPKK